MFASTTPSLSPSAEVFQPCSPHRPDLLKLLPFDERNQYESMVEAISGEVQKTHKHSGVTSFIKHMSLVHRFISRGNLRDPVRGVVCGVEFGTGFLLVNTDRLKKVLFRSKSCMNGCFQRLGYDVMRPSHDIVSLFTRLLPNVNPELFAIRQWCVRLARDGQVVCFTSSLPDSFAGQMEPIEMFSLPFQDTAKEDFNFLDIRSLLNAHPIVYP